MPYLSDELKYVNIFKKTLHKACHNSSYHKELAELKNIPVDILDRLVIDFFNGDISTHINSNNCNPAYAGRIFYLMLNLGYGDYALSKLPKNPLVFGCSYPNKATANNILNICKKYNLRSSVAKLYKICQRISKSMSLGEQIYICFSNFEKLDGPHEFKSYPELTDVFPHLSIQANKRGSCLQLEKEILGKNIITYVPINISTSTIKKNYELVIENGDAGFQKIIDINTKIDLSYNDYIEKYDSCFDSLQKKINSLKEKFPELSIFISKTVYDCITEYQNASEFCDITIDKFAEEMQNKINKIETNIEKRINVHAEKIILDKKHNQLKEGIGLSDYPSLFPLARSIKRKIIAHVGPTNSGKTYDAMVALMNANTGTYLAPLRLMALENFEVMQESNIICDMVTGEEKILFDDSTHTSSTIEMADLNKEVDVAIVDEVQLLTDPSRGWAWTQAIVGIPAKTIYVTGSAESLTLLRKIVSICGDELEIKEYQRKTPLNTLGTNISIKNTVKGDAIIAFSRKHVFMLRDKFIAAGKRVSTIYGALGPEIRKIESKRFREGETDILIATDAIGMGLNLPITRVLFSSLKKFDGHNKRYLTNAEIKQIGGRAGRYGLQDKGLVGILQTDFNEYCDTGRIKKALERELVSDKNEKLYFFPPFNAIKLLHDTTDKKDLFKIIEFICNKIIETDEHLRSPILEDVQFICDCTEKTNLSLYDKFRYLGVPIKHDKYFDFATVLTSWAVAHGNNTQIDITDIQLMTEKNALWEMENALALCTMYTWLAIKFPDCYAEYDVVMEYKNVINNKIISYLKKHNCK